MMMVEVPEALEKEPLSPVLASQLETMVPSGSALTGRMFPTLRAAIWVLIRESGILTFGSSINKLTCEKAFNSNEIFSSVLVLVWVSENNLGKWGSTTWIVNDFLNNTLDVSK